MNRQVTHIRTIAVTESGTLLPSTCPDKLRTMPDTTRLSKIWLRAVTSPHQIINKMGLLVILSFVTRVTAQTVPPWRLNFTQINQNIDHGDLGIPIPIRNLFLFGV